MTTFQDCSFGLGVESTYGTGVTPTRWLEFGDTTLDYSKAVKQGAGLRVGSRVAREARRAIVTAQGAGDVTVDVITKGMGLLWQAAMGSGTSTLVSAATYQQVFTLADVLPSLTCQVGIPEVGGTVDAYTYLGCTADSFELTFDNADILKLKTTLVAKDVTTATAYAAPSYSTGANLLTFAGGSVYTGTLTAPTATALASGATPIAGVRGGSVSVNHNAAQDRYNLGHAGRKDKPTVGLRDVSGALSVEYVDTTFRQAIMADTSMSLVLTWTGAALGTGVETLQVVVPAIRFEGSLPRPNAGNLILQDLKWTGLDNLTAAQPLWVITRTADAAL